MQFLSFLCVLKGLNSFHGCMNAPTNNQNCSRRGQEKVIYWRAYLFGCLFYYWHILGSLLSLDSFHCWSRKTFHKDASETPLVLHVLRHILAAAACASHLSPSALLGRAAGRARGATLPSVGIWHREEGAFSYYFLMWLAEQRGWQCGFSFHLSAVYSDIHVFPYFCK